MEVKIGSIAKSYIRLYPNMSNLELAKKINKENPDLYPNKDALKSIDNIRGVIRYYKGQNGDKNRTQTGHLKKDYHDHKDRCNEIARNKILGRNEKYTPAKILIFDIETSPMMAYVWRLWKQNVSYKNQLISDSWMMLTWSAKWLFEDKVMADKITPDEIKREDDKRVISSLCALIEEADIIVGHNSRKFDIRQINARRLKHDLPPMLPFEHIDTYRASKTAFDLPSHSLDYLAKYLGVGRKMETGGFELWRDCMQGKQEAIDKMEAYNIQDVHIQEEVYLKLRPYIKGHPNIGFYVEDNVHVCPKCGSEDIHWEGTYRTYMNEYDTFRCKDCGSIGRSRLSSLTTEQRRFLTKGL